MLQTTRRLIAGVMWQEMELNSIVRLEVDKHHTDFVRAGEVLGYKHNEIKIYAHGIL